MNQLAMRNQDMKEEIENWDDDDLDIEEDDLTFRSASLAPTVTSHRRDSISSRISMRSEIDSIQGDEERQVQVPGDDERSTIDAIATAKRAGIPIPKNVPASALLGGTIKRLGGKSMRKINKDDWDDGDLEFPDEGRLTMKKNHDTNFPEALGQIGRLDFPHQSNLTRQLQSSPKFNTISQSKLRYRVTSNTLLDPYVDADKHLGERGTIKVPQSRQIPKLLPFITPPTPHPPGPNHELQNTEIEGDFEQDFQLPLGNEPLKLSTRRETPKTPISLQDESDEWGEGSSLGTRHGGKRDRTSNRSSSATALSPSISSSLTMESDDEGLVGLLVPNEQINFEEILKRRQLNQSPDHPSEVKTTIESHAAHEDDFFSGLEIGYGDVFDSKKLTLNRNVKIRKTRLTSPVRPKVAVTLTFTNKSSTPLTTSRLPRPHGGLERMPSSLEPVSESGGPVMNLNRSSHSRLSGHSTQNSLNSIANSSTPASNNLVVSSTPRRRELSSKPSVTTVRKGSATTSAQLLKLKRSMPSIRSCHSINKTGVASRFDRLPYNADCNRPSSVSRPKTPVERGRGAEFSQAQNKIHHVPFLPAGASHSQSHHAVIKNPRAFRRPDSESSNNSHERHPSSRAVSRSTIRSPSPRRKVPEALAREVTTKRLLTRPVRLRNFGDGGELDVFDDLPTSRDSEQNFIKEPNGRGPPKLLKSRKKADKDVPVVTPRTPGVLAPMRSKDELPRFARDTNVSRLARENILAQRAPSAQGAPLARLTNQWKAKVAANTGLSSGKTQPVRPKKTKGPHQRPQLIKPLGNLNNPKCMSKFQLVSPLRANVSSAVKGMYYNPYTYRWEGNNCDLSSFDPPYSPHNASTPILDRKEPCRTHREKETLTPRPALIQHVKSTQNVQVVGGMIFDPQRMCWLKMSSQRNRHLGSSDDGTDSCGIDEDEDDVFKDVPDLEDSRPRECSIDVLNFEGLKEDFIVGEEFDVGPEFVRRQREEEERWRRKIQSWIEVGIGTDRGNANWRWFIRDMVMNHEI